MSDIPDAIEQDAVGPQSVSADGITVTKRPIKDQIDAYKFCRLEQACLAILDPV